MSEPLTPREIAALEAVESAARALSRWEACLTMSDYIPRQVMSPLDEALAEVDAAREAAA